MPVFYPEDPLSWPLRHPIFFIAAMRLWVLLLYFMFQSVAGKEPLYSVVLPDILAVERVRQEAFRKNNMFQIIQPDRILYVQVKVLYDLMCTCKEVINVCFAVVIKLFVFFWNGLLGKLPNSIVTFQFALMYNLWWKETNNEIHIMISGRFLLRI